MPIACSFAVMQFKTSTTIDDWTHLCSGLHICQAQVPRLHICHPRLEYEYESGNNGSHAVPFAPEQNA